ncbi:MAG: magnesium-translocating P-type ATPase [bacterium]|nr:magnesium-translocating P-type ATPase [bacterium]
MRAHARWRRPRPSGPRPADALLARLGTRATGLAAAEAAERLAAAAARRPPRDERGIGALFAEQLRSPIVLLLLGAAVLSFGLGDAQDGTIILVIVFASAGLGVWQEHDAADAVRSLMATVRTTASVLRDGRAEEIPIGDLVVGDVVTLSAGDAVPGDARLLAARDLHVVEAALTGETFPVEKEPAVLAPDLPLARRTNALFLGTHVASGTGTAVVVATGPDTEFGAISDRLRLRPPETEFERGLRRFGALLAQVTLLLVGGIFAVNVGLQRPWLESLLFALALAVGLTPQLLPAIVSVNLAAGAKRLARKKVITKRLTAIENLGSVDVLCSDKTGTLTEGCVRLDAAIAPDGTPSARTLRYAALNALHQTGFRNPIDEAVRAAAPPDLEDWRKLDDLPYDFVRKRLSVLLDGPEGRLLLTKGAVRAVLDVCTQCEDAAGRACTLDVLRDDIDARVAALAAEGLRTLAVAVRAMPGDARVGRDDEAAMTFVGLLTFADPPREGVAATLAELGTLGVRLCVITGDDRRIATTVARQVGLPVPRLLTGPELRDTSEDALVRRVDEVDVFAEIEPNQKERVIRAFQKAGHVVGYLGDGINDAPALHAADVGMSVEGAVDVARDAADLVLLDRDPAVLLDGVREGRRTFANTLKYVFMATSANFGNMFSMAGASLFLPFLPLLPKQILLTNLLTDLPEMAIATDRVDDEWVAHPRRFDVTFIRDFMIVFGVLSSVFDYLTFAVLLFVLDAGPEEFRTGWFVESVLSATLIVLVIRTRRAAWRSPPGRALTVATVGVGMVTVAIPWTPLAAPLGLVPLPASFFPALAVVVALYVGSAEIAKRRFWARPARRTPGAAVAPAPPGRA